MAVLDIFALIVLLVLLAAVVGVLIALGMMPGRIAHQRGHPQAEAIAVCGWWGLLTLGILLPLAWIWAYTKPAGPNAEAAEEPSGEPPPEPSGAGDEEAEP